MRRPKISVIGAGNVGATTAQWIAAAQLGDIVLLDIPETGDMPKGKALDLFEATPILGCDSQVIGTSDYADTVDSDIVVITAGIPRKAGMSRDDLLATNARIVGSVSEQIAKTSPKSIVIVISNPLDAMTYKALYRTGFEKHRIIGQAGVLDAARFRSFLAEELNVSVKDISAMLLGGHGDSMVPLLSCASVGGIPVRDLVPEGRLEEIVQRTRNGGAEVVALLKTGSAFYAPAAAVAEMVEAIVRDKRRLIPCSVYCEEEYGVGGYCIGVPVILGHGGVQRIVEITLSDKEKKWFRESVEATKSLVEIMKAMKLS